MFQSQSLALKDVKKVSFFKNHLKNARKKSQERRQEKENEFAYMTGKREVTHRDHDVVFPEDTYE